MLICLPPRYEPSEAVRTRLKSEKTSQEKNQHFFLLFSLGCLPSLYTLQEYSADANCTSGETQEPKTEKYSLGTRNVSVSTREKVLTGLPEDFMTSCQALEDR